MEIQEKSFIVTGATRGIGRGLAELLVRHGARVAINGRNGKNLEATGAALRKSGGDILSIVGDVGSDKDAQRLVAATLREFGKIDVLINNAAILGKRSPLVETPPSVWEEVLRVNVIGTVNMIRHALPHMEKRGSGLIINLSSGWGREASGYVAAYCASKFAVEAITQAVSEEIGASGVILFALNPGVIATEMLQEAFGCDVSAYPTPEQIASQWLNLFAKVDRSWHGTSRDLDKL